MNLPDIDLHFKRQWLSKAISRIRRRAFEKGTDFAITAEDLILPDFCPLLQIKLSYNASGPIEAWASIDRCNNSFGYVPGNVWVISHQANSLKQAKDWFEFLKELAETRSLDKHVLAASIPPEDLVLLAASVKEENRKVQQLIAELNAEFGHDSAVSFPPWLKTTK